MIMKKEIIDLLNDQTASKVLATVDSEGIPNVVPKGSISAIDDKTVVFADIFGDKTNKNLEETKRAAIAVFKQGKGYQLKGTFKEFQKSGSIFDKYSKMIKSGMGKDIKSVGIIQIEEIFDLTPKF
ncbi:MAG TPA: pyridoxamine 5'-phosphate oxidase family protein [Halobacteria archaeon]|jgi:hypothetical protein|nr:pyridoxamine 5'-phosphate oxidase family protein [Halobacteria archaeon]